MQGEESFDSRVYKSLTDAKQQMEGLLYPGTQEQIEMQFNSFYAGRIRHRHSLASIHFLPSSSPYHSLLPQDDFQLTVLCFPSSLSRSLHDFMRL
jgi:hypothetical protein